MKFETQKERVLIPAGDHILKLTKIEPREMDDLYGKSDTGKVTRVLWAFVSNETDDNGTPYEYGIFTNDRYGNEKAGMTLLIDMLVPGMTADKFDDYETDELIGKRFRAQIKHVKKPDGGMKATHVFITPVGSKAKPAAEAKQEEAKPAEAKPSKRAADFDPLEDE